MTEIADEVLNGRKGGWEGWEGWEGWDATHGCIELPVFSVLILSRTPIKIQRLMRDGNHLRAEHVTCLKLTSSGANFLMGAGGR